MVLVGGDVRGSEGGTMGVPPLLLLSLLFGDEEFCRFVRGCCCWCCCEIWAAPGVSTSEGWRFIAVGDDDVPVISLSSVIVVDLAPLCSALIIDDNDSISDVVIFCLLASGDDGFDDTDSGRAAVVVEDDDAPAAEAAAAALREAAPGTSTASFDGMSPCATSHSTAHLAA